MDLTFENVQQSSVIFNVFDSRITQTLYA